jgi:adenosylcobinamide-GDP ribazoletransferase
VLVAFSFMTRLPLGGPMLERERLGGAVALFPLVGLCLGAALLVLARGLALFGEAEITAFILLLTWVLVTGALHLDGVADLCDALGAGRGGRERTLSILRDSRIGAFGATGLALVLLGKWVALAALARAGVSAPLLVAPMVARWISVCILFCLPAARAEGLGWTMASATRHKHVIVASVICVLGAIPAGWAALLPSVAGVLGAVLVAAWARQRLGGMTGDVLGAAIEVAELCYLLCAALGS